MLNINCQKRILSFEKPIVMGIINLTNDSFYQKSRFKSHQLIDIAGKMIDDGAIILDLGACSSRPGAMPVEEEIEINKINEAVTTIKAQFPDVFMSIDTFRASVADIALRNGADIINDISAATMDEQLLEVVYKYKAGYVLMHMQGIPLHMQTNPVYTDVTLDVVNFFKNKIRELKKRGIIDIIIDPGFGFGKSLVHNYKLLSELTCLNIFECPLMVGVSRKSMIYKPLKIIPENALNGTSALHMFALERGAQILRAHDVKQANEVIELWKLATS